jgi:hypothetical protein
MTKYFQTKKSLPICFPMDNTLIIIPVKHKQIDILVFIDLFGQKGKADII